MAGLSGHRLKSVLAAIPNKRRLVMSDGGLISLGLGGRLRWGTKGVISQINTSPKGGSDCRIREKRRLALKS